MTRITLPWPDSKLSPNARIHWSQLAKHKRVARERAFVSTRAVGASVAASGPIPMLVTFYPPDKRRRDRDNCIAAMKASMDGIADGLRCDDSRFEPTYRMGDVVKGGAVVIELGDA